jgi:phosphoribosyl 1,2-cyclic phosphodiesterase
LRICSLASGSKGNATLIEAGDQRILVDNGLSVKRLEERLSDLDIHAESITALLITHEHSDHIAGAGVLARKHNTAVYIHPECENAANKKIFHGTENIIHFDTNISLPGIHIEAVSLSHDAAKPFAFTFQNESHKIGIITDLGFATNLVKERFKDCDALVLEMNHDPEMLKKNERYKWPLKQRILSKFGHLSNQEGAELLKELINEKLKTVYLAHLSEENNDMFLARDVLDEVNSHSELYREIKVEMCYQSKISELTEL